MARKKPNPKRSAKTPKETNEAKAPDPNKLTIGEMVDLLRHGGSKSIDAEKLAADLAAGAPINGETMSLIHYAAWLVKMSATK